MEKELLQQAINSILHGSTQIISSTDSYGNTVTQEMRINDLRVPLVEKLASKLVQTDGFRIALEKAFTAEVIKKLQDKAIETYKFSDLPYKLREQIESQLKAENVTLKKFKIVIEAVENQS